MFSIFDKILGALNIKVFSKKQFIKAGGNISAGGNIVVGNQSIVNSDKNERVEDISNEILIVSQDKRFLTSWQCCSNCTKYAIDSILEYRKFLLNKKVALAKINHLDLVEIVDDLLDKIRNFLSISEQHNTDRDHRFMSEQIEILRNDILKSLQKLCKDRKIQAPAELFRMMKTNK